MSDFTGLNIDKDVKESTGGFTLIPAGKYKACIVGDELKDTKAGTGKIWSVKVQIIDGEYFGEIITDNINIINPSEKAQAIGQGTLKRICNICGVPFPPQNTSGLMGKPLEIDVKVEKFTSNTTGNELESNKIKAYNTISQAINKPAPKNNGWQ